MAVDRGVHVYNMTCAARDPTGSRKERVLQFRPGEKKKGVFHARFEPGTSGPGTGSYPMQLTIVHSKLWYMNMGSVDKNYYCP